MKLDQYLESARKCPNEVVVLDGQEIDRVTAEHGVYDNYHVELKGSFNEFAERLVMYLEKIKGRIMVPNPRQITHPGKQFYYSDVERGLTIQIFDFLPILSKAILESYSIAKDVFDIGELNISISLHPERSNVRRFNSGLLDFVEELGEYCRSRGILFCIPKSVGWADHSLERMVWSPDELEEKIQQLVKSRGVI